MTVATEARAAGRVGNRPTAPWLGRVVGLSCPVLLALYALKPLNAIKDPDSYWHIVAGQHLLHSGQFVLADPFGAATENVWILNQWLPEVLMAWAHANFGLPGVAWLMCLGSFLIGAAIYLACRRRASPLATALVLALVFVALSGSLSPRPQLVTFALTAVTTSTWLLTREDGRPRWWLVPVSWLWACSHGMWFVGPLVGGVVIVGMALEKRASLREAARLALVPVLSVAIATMTPVGPELFTSPFQVGGVTAYISEWQRPAWTDIALIATLGLVLSVVVGLLRERRWQWSPILLALLALALALTWARTVGLGAIVAAPLAASSLQALTRQHVPTTSKRERAAAAVAGLAALLLAAATAPAVAASPAIGPNGLDRALDALPAGSVVCNDQRDGGWFMLQHPQLRPTMDTRVELYSIEHIEAYLGFVAGRQGWQSYPQRLGCGYTVLPTATAVVAQMRATGHWQQVAGSARYVLLKLKT